MQILELVPYQNTGFSSSAWLQLAQVEILGVESRRGLVVRGKQGSEAAVIVPAVQLAE